jgi:hypothetical protein
MQKLHATCGHYFSAVWQPVACKLYPSGPPPITPGRVSSKETKINFGSNRNKICFAFVSVCFVKPKTKNFGLFWCFEPILKQLKQTDCFVTNRNKPNKTGRSQNFLKNTQYKMYIYCPKQLF